MQPEQPLFARTAGASLAVATALIAAASFVIIVICSN